MSARKLSPKQEVFVQEYLKDLNAHASRDSRGIQRKKRVKNRY